MTDEQNPPSKDPADDSTLAGAFRSIFHKLAQRLDVMLPAEVLEYDRPSNTATVRALIAVLTTTGQAVPRASIAKVPVLAFGGGGFVINFPLKKGDKGWIEANDRDISLFMQASAESTPNTVRLHSFEDSRFIPDMFAAFDLADVGDDEMTIQHESGGAAITISPTRIRMKAPEVTIDTGQFTVNGPSHLNGNIEAFGTILSNGVPVDDTHTHGGVQTGGGNTLEPNG